jgi:hypothetical protein
MDKEIHGPRPSGREARDLRTWQNRLLPVMLKMVIGLTIFFFVASFVQLFYLQNHMATSTGLDLKALLPVTKPGDLADKSSLDAVRWTGLVALEQYSIQRRYHQANVLLMARVWTRYLGFVTGMICTLVGAIFILGKLQEPASALSGEAPSWKFSVTTTSPGLMLAVLGTVLMVTTLVVPARIEVEDKATFVGTWNGGGHSLQLPEELLKDVPAPSNTKTPTTSVP